MGDYQVAKREQQVLWNIALYMHMCRLLAELQGVSVTTYSEDQVDWFLPKPFQYSREEVGPPYRTAWVRRARLDPRGRPSETENRPPVSRYAVGWTDPACRRAPRGARQ